MPPHTGARVLYHEEEPTFNLKLWRTETERFYETPWERKTRQDLVSKTATMVGFSIFLAKASLFEK